MGKITIRNKLSAPSKCVTLLQAPPLGSHIDIITELLRLRRDRPGVLINSNRPSNILIEQIDSKKTPVTNMLREKKLCIVDLISRSVGSPEVAGVIYVASASELSATQMAIEEALSRIGEGGGWLFLDSISTLLVYNSPEALLQFLHFLIGRLRVLQFDGYILSVCEGVDGKIFSTVAQFCDKVVRF